MEMQPPIPPAKKRLPCTPKAINPLATCPAKPILYRSQRDPYSFTPHAFRNGDFPPPCPPPPHHIATLPLGWHLKTHRYWMATVPARVLGNPYSTRPILSPDHDTRVSDFCLRGWIWGIPCTCQRPGFGTSATKSRPPRAYDLCHILPER